MEGAAFVLIGILILDMDLPSLNAKLLPKLPSVDLENALCMFMVTALLLSRELTPYKQSTAMGPHW